MKRTMKCMLAGVAIFVMALVMTSGKKSDEVSASGGKEPSKLTSANIGILRLVPAGTFQRDENATNTSTVGAFYMSEKEITWEQFVKVTGFSKPAFTDAAKYSKSIGGPVTMMTWYHCIAFCNKLSMLEGVTPVYTISGTTDPAAWGAVPENVTESWDAAVENPKANGYRLPSEMEWEWAAMGAVDGATGNQKAFAGSSKLNNIDDYAWTTGNSENILHKVGTKKANELGIYDMSGNANEWCWDWKAEYPAGVLDNETFRGASNGGEYGQRVLRGGSFALNAYDVTVAIRSGLYPNNCGVQNGFRVVRRP